MLFLKRGVFETGVFFKEGEVQVTGRSVALFGYNQFCLSFVFLGWFILRFANQEQDHVGILLNGTAFPQV